MRTRKLVFLRTLGRSNCVCLYRYAKKKMKFMLCVPKMQIALVPIERKIKFNVRPSGTYESELDFAPKHFNLVPSFPGYEIAQRLIFLFCFYSVFRFSFSCFFVLAFFTIAIVKQAHYKRISLHLHPVLHPITLCYIRSAVVLLGHPA